MSLDEISPLTFSVGNTMKRISVIVSSIIIFHTPVQPVNALGAAIAILGTFLYSQVLSVLHFLILLCLSSFIVSFGGPYYLPPKEKCYLYLKHQTHSVTYYNGPRLHCYFVWSANCQILKGFLCNLQDLSFGESLQWRKNVVHRVELVMNVPYVLPSNLINDILLKLGVLVSSLEIAT